MKIKTSALSVLFIALTLSASIFACRMPLDDGTGNKFCTHCGYSYREQVRTQAPQRAVQRQPEQKRPLKTTQQNRINVLQNQITGNKK